MGHIPVVEKKPDTPRTAKSWMDGDLSFDHSDDEALAAEGDEDAIARQSTRHKLAMAKLSRKNPID